MSFAWLLKQPAQAGGFVSDGRVCGIMEVSRSIGDAALKCKGVSSLPDTTRILLTQVQCWGSTAVKLGSDCISHVGGKLLYGNAAQQRDAFFILACDGLWRVFDNSQAVDFVSAHVQKQKQDEEAGVSRDNADVAMALVREAIRGRLALDNVSAVVVMLKW